jgi:hypothetical protein
MGTGVSAPVPTRVANSRTPVDALRARTTEKEMSAHKEALLEK